MAEALSITLHAMASEALAGTSDPVDIGERRSAARLDLQVIAATAAALVVTVQTSDDEAGPFRNVAAFASVASPSALELHVAGLLQWVRVSWTLASAAEFSVGGEAHTLYATPSQIALNDDVLSGATADQKAKACINASGEAEGYLNSGYVLPLTSWSPELARKVGLVAGWEIIQMRGIRADGADELVKAGNDDAIRWLARVASGKIVPPGIVDSTPEEHEFSGYVVSDGS